MRFKELSGRCVRLLIALWHPSSTFAKARRKQKVSASTQSGVHSLQSARRAIIAERTHPQDFASLITLQLQQLMVRSTPFLEAKRESKLVVPLAHLQYGVQRIVIFDIDLHHGMWAWTPLSI